MTTDCERLMTRFQFPKNEWRDLEEALFYAENVPQLERVIKKYRFSKDNVPYTPSDYKEISRRMFGKGKRINADFWSAYNIFDSVCEMTKYDLGKINEMSISLPRVRISVRVSKVKNVSYIYKVWQDTEEERVVNNLDKVFTTLTPHAVKVVNFD